MSLFDIGAMRRKLKDLPGIKVDVVSALGLPHKLRDTIPATAIPV